MLWSMRPWTKLEINFSEVYMTFLLLGLIGFAGGVTSGMFGVGGGVIFVPFLIILKHYNPHVAIGTSLAVVIPTAVFAALKNAHAGTIDWKIVPLIAVFALIGAWLGAGLSLQLEAGLLRRIFAVFLFLVSLKMFFLN